MNIIIISHFHGDAQRIQPEAIYKICFQLQLNGVLV